MLTAADQDPAACECPSLQNLAIQRDDQALARQGVNRFRGRAPGRLRNTNDAERRLGNAYHRRIEIKALTRKLLESSHTGRIENPAQRLGTCQDKGGGGYRTHPHS